jgi:hypothetical protein
LEESRTEAAREGGSACKAGAAETDTARSESGLKCGGDNQKNRKRKNPKRQISPKRLQRSFRELRRELDEITGDHQHGNDNQDSK